MYSISLLCLIIAFCIALIPLPLAQAQSNIFSTFCAAVRANLAQGPQSGGCLLQGQAANNNQLQQNQQQLSPLQQQSTFNPNVASGVNQQCGANQVLQGLNCVPSSCPTGQQLSNTVPVTCVPIPTIPIAIVTTPSQVVSRDSLVTLDGTGSVATTSGATIVSFSWVQTAGPSVGVLPNTARAVFTAPNNSTTLAFSLTVLDSVGLTSQPATVSILVR